MTRPSNRWSRGFTLLELIISVALVLVLMLAITRIFTITSATVGASQGLAAGARDARAAQSVIGRDIAAMAGDSPFIIIRNSIRPAFRNADDAKADKDYDPNTNINTEVAGDTNTPNVLTADYDGSGTETNTSPLTVNNRNHRVDLFTFCARDRYARQTGDTGTLVADESGPEAWIWYGHLSLPNGTGQFSATPENNEPGKLTAAANPINFYANQWILGREAMVLLRDPASAEFYQRTPATPPGGNDLTPLALTATGASKRPDQGAYFGGSNARLIDGRYDLIDTDIDTLKKIINQYTGTAPWYLLNTNTGVGANSDRMVRFRGSPQAVKPVSAASASRQVPLFLPACSQFIVEYAGDFLTQDQYGNPQYTTDTPTGSTILIPKGPDGAIDFIVNPNTGVRSIQWFGMPRSPNSNPTIDAETGDVVPFADFLGKISARVLSAGATPPALTVTPATAAKKYNSFGEVLAAGFTFEKYTQDPQGRSRSVNLQTSYAASGTPFPYFAVWGPSSAMNSSQPRPKMYRITFTIDRPELAGRTAAGQTFEYVFNAPN